MSSRIRIYDKDGGKVGDIRASTVRSWTLASAGVIGECKFDISRRDSKAIEKYLRYGNYIIVTDGDARLPEWVGVIYPPRSWGISVITVTAYQLEKIFQWRSTPDETYSGTPGSIFTQIVQHTNSSDHNEKKMMIDQVFNGGDSIEEKLGDDAYSHLQYIAEAAGHDFDVVHELDDNGKLSLKTNWYDRKGYDTAMVLQEGYNIDLPEDILEESGDLFNEVTGYSDSSSDDSRLVGTQRDLAAISKYGLYQVSTVFDGVKNESTLNSSILSALELSIEPLKSLSVTAVDKGKTFANLEIGNLITVKLQNEGFMGDGALGLYETARIMGMETDDNEGNVKLVAEVQNAES